MSAICNECKRPKCDGGVPCNKTHWCDWNDWCHDNCAPSQYPETDVAALEEVAAVLNAGPDVVRPQPTAPTSVDLTKLIGQVNEMVSLGLEKCTARNAERDEIVLALRVLRVRRHPRCQQIRFGSRGGFEFSILPATSDEHAAEAWAFARWMELDEAERILGYGGGDAG